eukprot:UN19119
MIICQLVNQIKHYHNRMCWPLSTFFTSPIRSERGTNFFLHFTFSIRIIPLRNYIF